MPTTKSRTITIKKNDIFFDINALSLSLTQATGADVVKADAISTDSLSATGQRELTRLVDRRAGEIRSMLRKLITTDTASSANDQLSTADFAFALTVDTEFDDNQMVPLTALMHEYIVKGALSDWYKNNGINGAGDSLASELKGIEERIKELAFYRTVPQYRS